MKKMIFAMLSMAALLTFNSCELLDTFNDGDDSSNPFSTVLNNDLDYSPCEEDIDLSFDALPDAIVSYLESNYAGYDIDDVEEYLGDGSQRFGVDITYQGQELELLFSANGDLINSGVDTEDVSVDASQLPQAALDYLDTEFPDAAIEEVSIEVEFGWEFFDVDLSNGIDVYFTADGTFACSEDDDEGDDDEGEDNDEGDDDDEGEDDDDDEGDDDDDEGDDDDDEGDDDDINLPEAAANYIESNFPGYTIDYVDREDFCDGYVIEVEIEMGTTDRDLYFSPNGDFLFEADDINTAALPDAVASTLQAEYPNFQVDDAETLMMADGSTRYWVEVENDDEDYEVVLEEDGTIVCSFED